MKGGKFTFLISRPVTDKEGKELEALLLNWALCNGMRIGSYFYDIIDSGGELTRKAIGRSDGSEPSKVRGRTPKPDDNKLARQLGKSVARSYKMAAIK